MNITVQRYLCFAIVVAAACAGCATTGHEQSRVAAEKSWTRLRADMKAGLARQQFDRGEYLQAYVAITEATRLCPDNPAYHRFTARCCIERHEVPAARIALDRAEELGDKSAELAGLRGLLAEHQRRPAAAADHYGRAASIEPDNPDFAAAAAECLIELNRRDEALTLLNRHIELCDRDPRLLHLRAAVFDLNGQPKPAVADYAELYANVSDDPAMEERYALALMRAGDFREAVSLLEGIIDREDRDDEESGNAIRSLARAYNRVGRQNKSRTILQKHLRTNPDDAQAWWLLTEAAMADESWRLAQSSICKGEFLSPARLEWSLANAYISWRLGQTENARATLNTLLAEHPDLPEARAFLGRLNSASPDQSKK